MTSSIVVASCSAWEFFFSNFLRLLEIVNLRLAVYEEIWMIAVSPGVRV